MAELFGVIGAARFEHREPPAETGELLAELAQCSTADLAKLFGAGHPAPSVDSEGCANAQPDAAPAALPHLNHLDPPKPVWDERGFTIQIAANAAH
jgi:hypothetical protein